MALSITPLAGGVARERTIAWTLLLEALLVAAAIGLLLPLFTPLALQDTGRDARFAAPPATPQVVSAQPAPRALVLTVKNEAMRTLLRTASWQWAAWAALGLVLLNLSRRGGSPVLGIALALVAWAGAAWVGRVPWPLGTEHAFVLARPSAGWVSMPAPFVLWLLAAAGCVIALAPWLRRTLADAPQQPTSAFAYPGLVLATGVGWLIILDLSANGHAGDRYLALYHHGHLWLAMLVFTLAAFLRQPLGRALAWALSLLDGAATQLSRRLGGVTAAALLLCVAMLGVGLSAMSLLNMRQLTSELGRMWLIVGAAWFFFLRGTPLTERMARSGSSVASLARYVWPLLFVVVVLVGAMVLTHDMGPLLIAGYGAGAFVAASVAMWRVQRSGATVSAYAVAVVLFVAWIAMTTAALFKLGSIDDVTAARLENASAPLASANDHLALVTWFQRAAPPTGFGPGGVPWCGFAASTGCAGVPAQIQSDYTFTALVGMFGWNAAWAMTIGTVLWLHAIVHRHGRASRGEPRLVHRDGRLRSDPQAFLSWLCVAWVVLALCQLAVTVAGNLAVIPLTGVTFPFVSFGMTSLVVSMAFLGLAIDVRARDHG